MPNNTPSWNRLMKDPDFHSKYELNTNPAYGRTYIPKGTKAASPNKNNPNRGKVPPVKTFSQPQETEYDFIEDSDKWPDDNED